MLRRLDHALRFALTTLVAVYAIGVAWELLDVYRRGDAAAALGAAEAFGFNEVVWRWVAGAEAAAVLLLRLGDLNVRPPSWPFAWALAAWLAVASLAVATALEKGRWVVGLLCVAVAVGVWLLLHRHIPGWPGPWRAAAPDGELR